MFERLTVTFWQLATGATLSCTATVAVQVLVLPFTSVTVSTVVFAPTSLQANVLALMPTLATPQASLEPSLMAPAVVEPVPAPSNCTVTSWHAAVGAMPSTIVATAVQVLPLPLTSTTVKVRLTAPTSLQPKAVWLRPTLAMPQASDDPLSTAAAVVPPEPVVPSCTVMAWQMAFGATLSSTVTVAEQVLEFPLPSVTVSVTALVPTLPQVKLVGFRPRPAICRTLPNWSRSKAPRWSISVPPR